MWSLTEQTPFHRMLVFSSCSRRSTKHMICVESSATVYGDDTR